MKTIGLIGGMSWESSIEYYRILNETVRNQLGGLHSARCIMTSLDFAEVEKMRQEENWEAASNLLISAARSLEKGGAECVLLCTNTMHKIAGSIQANIQVPFFHIADATAQSIHAQNINTVGLLGTRFTMEEDFYRGRLEDKHHLRVIVPEQEEREIIHRVIYNELCLGRTLNESREYFRAVIKNLVKKGAQGIILGCTEIGMLVKSEDSPVPLFDTTVIHAQYAVSWALTSDEKGSF